MRAMNKGALELARVTAPRGGKARVAKQLRVTLSAVSYWASGTNLPNVDMRPAIEALLGIPWDDWDKPAEGEG